MPDATLRSRFRGALVGVAVGDALGAPLEGMPGPIAPDVVAEIADGRGVLRYTDDTAMTIALAESLTERRGLDQDHLARHFARRFVEEPWRGYGAGAVQTLARIDRGDPWRDAAGELFGGRGSYGNGGAMRVAPAALFAFPDHREVGVLARASARVTHAHALGIEGAAAQAASVAIALEGGATAARAAATWVERVRGACERPELAERLAVVPALVEQSAPDAVVERLGNGVDAVSSVPAALTAALGHPDDLAGAVRFALSLGGDTDTIAAMTGAIAGAALGVEALPDAWLERVEGVETLTALADQLATDLPSRDGGI